MNPALKLVYTFPLIIGLFGLVPACDADCQVDCSCIAPGINVVAVDAITQEAVDATITSSPTNCVRDSVGVFHCEAPEGTTNTITIAAPGYTSQTITVVVPEIDPDACCACGTYVLERIELTAMP